MIIVEGDLWDEIGVADILLVTTNATVRKDGHLVMGRGAAREAAERYPDLPLQLARLIVPLHRKMRVPVTYTYGVVLSDIADGKTRIGAFQVKEHWSHRADLDIIRHSANVLTALLAQPQNEMRIAMNYPGIGNGGLLETDVAPVISVLPDNVIVYRRRN